MAVVCSPEAVDLLITDSSAPPDAVSKLRSPGCALSSPNAEMAVAGQAGYAVAITGVFFAHSVLLALVGRAHSRVQARVQPQRGALGTILMGAPVGSVVAMLVFPTFCGIPRK